MRVLLDECLDRRILRHLTGHQVPMVSKCGWRESRTGKLFALAEKEFDVFVTMDRNLSFQKSLPKFGIALVVLRARSNRLGDLLPPVPETIAAISSAKPGVALLVGG